MTTVTGYGNTVTSYDCTPSCQGTSVSTPEASVYIKCCNTDLCNNGTAIDKGNNVASQVLSTFALG